jgi:hypothetical protein
MIEDDGYSYLFELAEDINEMGKRQFRHEIEQWDREDFKDFVFENFYTSEELWWFIDHLDADKFDAIVKTFGKKFIKKLAHKLDKWARIEEEPRHNKGDHHRKL